MIKPLVRGFNMQILIEKEDPYLWVKKISIISIIFGIGISILWISLGLEAKGVENNSGFSALATIQGNTLLPASNPLEPVRIKKVKMVITGYSSTTWQTDDTPFITASGKIVEEGIVANNMLPFGTEIRIPELYGDKIFVVEDRMHPRKNGYQLDIWFPEYKQAKNFGAVTTYVEIMEI